MSDIDINKVEINCPDCGKLMNKSDTFLGKKGIISARVCDNCKITLGIVYPALGNEADVKFIKTK